jgi:hypothetical protein
MKGILGDIPAGALFSRSRGTYHGYRKKGVPPTRCLPNQCSGMSGDLRQLQNSHTTMTAALRSISQPGCSY